MRNFMRFNSIFNTHFRHVYFCFFFLYYNVKWPFSLFEKKTEFINKTAVIYSASPWYWHLFKHTTPKFGIFFPTHTVRRHWMSCQNTWKIKTIVIQNERLVRTGEGAVQEESSAGLWIAIHECCAAGPVFATAFRWSQVIHGLCYLITSAKNYT